MMSSNPSVAAVLRTLREVSSEDREYTRVEYLCQMHLGSINAKIHRVYALNEQPSYQPVLSRYRQFLQGGRCTIMHSVINSQDLDPITNNLPDVITRGYNTGDTGLFFPCGISTGQVSRGMGEGVMILNDVAIRHTQRILTKDISADSLYRIASSQKYDSIYVEEGSEGGEGVHPFRHNYVLMDRGQILPTHIAIIRYAETNYGQCEVCGNNAARVYCENDNLDMCLSCDTEYHREDNRVSSKHRRVDIGEKEVGVENCPVHPKMKRETYCMHCKLSLCTNCQISGIHSEEGMRDHKLVSAGECYTFLKDTRRLKTPLMAKIKGRLTQQAEAVEWSHLGQAADRQVQAGIRDSWEEDTGSGAEITGRPRHSSGQVPGRSGQCRNRVETQAVRDSLDGVFHQVPTGQGEASRVHQQILHAPHRPRRVPAGSSVPRSEANGGR
jgi:hypothetical protein